ncbi:MAG: (Fe-S)-binding protein [Acidimicrobiia bacterium]|nr:(Fe-S)-binding protein [Acidimicrobiia bacterium]
MVWITDQQPTVSELASCVQCGLCLPHCPTFRLTGLEIASPRGRLAAMNAVADGVIDLDGDFEEAMTFCLNCRACEAVCPSLVPYGRVMEGVRAELAVQRPTSGRRLRHLVLGRLLPSRAIMALVTAGAGFIQRSEASWLLPKPLRRSFSGVRPLLHRQDVIGRSFEPAETPRGTVGLLNGCVMGPWFSDVHRAVIAVLTSAGYRVVVPASQTCCGALAAHDGAAAAATRLARSNLAAFADVDLVVADAAGCSAHLKEYGHWVEGGDGFAAKVRDVTELVAALIDEGALPTSSLDRGPVAVQDPCHLRHAQRILAAPRRILSAAGYTPVEVDPDGLCCGAAGIYSLLEPQASSELGGRKAAQVVATGSTLVASANPGCEMQLRGHLAGWQRVAHPVELYDEAVITRAQ